MASRGTLKLSPKAADHINKGKKRKMCMDTRAQNNKKQLRNSGKEYVGARSLVKPAKPLPTEVRVIRMNIHP
jgi:hypothetical protein